MLCCRAETVTSVVEETGGSVDSHKKRKKCVINTAADSTLSQAGTESRKKKKKKKMHSGTKLPAISDDRLKAYGINLKKFKYFHRKKLLEEQR